MSKLSDKIRHKILEIVAALFISVIVYLLSFTSPFQRLELLSLDARFNLRPSIATNPNIALVEIDDTALKEEGRWQDWTRDKHARIVDIIRKGKGALMGFDIYFPEQSKRILYPIDVKYASSLEELMAAFPDYDKDLADAAKTAKNVFWGSTFMVPEEDAGKSDSSRSSYFATSDEVSENLEKMLEKGFAIRKKKEDVNTIIQAFAPGAIPISQLSESARGVGFAQISKETDGVVRRYPTFIRYDKPLGEDSEDSLLFPSIGLAMACDYLQVPLKNLKIESGKYIELPEIHLPDGSRKNLRIPINARGEMIVNWVGDYKETFRHFPYSSLIRLDDRLILQEVKKFLSTQDPSLFNDMYQLTEAVYNHFFEMPNLTEYVSLSIYLYGAHWYETLIEQGKAKEFGNLLFIDLFNRNPEEYPELYTSQKELFEDVRLNIAALKLLSEEPDTSVPEISEKLKISYEDAEDLHIIISRLLEKGGPGPMDRPLYFRPSASVGKEQISFENLNGGVFFYGLTASATHDLNPMPFSPRYPMVGALANVFNTIVTDQFIREISVFWRLPLFLVVGLIAGYILSSSTAIRGSLFTVLFLVFYVLFAYELFTAKGIWIDVAGPIGIVILSEATIVWHKFSTAEKQRKFIRNAFEYYMNPAVVEEIAKNPDMLELGGKKMELTAFFSDVASFTSISEKLSEQNLVELLNEYLTEMTEIVLKHYGNLDKYEGDAIMAFFGAPIHFPDHATRACHTALEMQEKLKELRDKWKSEGRPELTARIGINTGPMVVGNMGSRKRFDYTVMGDAVNLASRLEGVNKQYSTEIMISEFTLEHCKESIITREIDLIRVKGKEVPVTIHEVLGRMEDGLSDELKSVLEHYSAGLEAYRNRKWEESIEHFQLTLDSKPNDGPSLTYLKRCKEYIKTSPPDDWDGVYVMMTK